jgi:tripeptide aminopeptidase
VEYRIEDTYSNISNAIGEDRRAIDLMFAAMEVTRDHAKTDANARGHRRRGALGKGLLTPNFFTGAHNFHSKFEFLPLSSFEASYKTALQICLLAAR